MASVTYGKCYLWQKYYVKCNYGKNIMANETEPSVPWNSKIDGFHGSLRPRRVVLPPPHPLERKQNKHPPGQISVYAPG